MTPTNTAVQNERDITAHKEAVAYFPVHALHHVVVLTTNALQQTFSLSDHNEY